LGKGFLDFTDTDNVGLVKQASLYSKLSKKMALAAVMVYKPLGYIVVSTVNM